MILVVIVSDRSYSLIVQNKVFHYMDLLIH